MMVEWARYMSDPTCIFHILKVASVTPETDFEALTHDRVCKRSASADWCGGNCEECTVVGAESELMSLRDVIVLIHAARNARAES